jgi:muconolactone delta-isomerase
LEFLVSMTTHVPDGTSDEAVADVRAREASHTRELAARGHILRLWRPPLGPGEWRTLGLFAAADRAELEQVLISMPLRVWRTDDVTDLAHHPNDPVVSAQDRPPPETDGPGGEFFTTFVTDIPDDTPARDVDEARAGEARRTRELGEQGHLIRLWLLPRWPDESHALGLWRSQDTEHVRAMLDSLPMAPWLTEGITPLSPHPSDPAAAGSRPAAARGPDDGSESS